MVSQQKNKMIFSSILADFEFWLEGSGIFDIFSYSYEDGSCISPWTFFLRRKCPKKAEVSCLTLRRSFEQLLHNSQTLVKLFLLLSLNVIKIQVVEMLVIHTIVGQFGTKYFMWSNRTITHIFVNIKRTKNHGNISIIYPACQYCNVISIAHISHNHTIGSGVLFSSW